MNILVHGLRKESDIDIEALSGFVNLVVSFEGTEQDWIDAQEALDELKKLRGANDE